MYVPKYYISVFVVTTQWGRNLQLTRIWYNNQRNIRSDVITQEMIASFEDTCMEHNTCFKYKFKALSEMERKN